MESIQDLPILRTKLYRPPVPADLVPRDALVARLEAGRTLPLTLVSAPAGYGKSTLVSHWLETSDAASAWLSLDASENEPRIFLEYLVAAVRGLFREACNGVTALLRHGELSPPTVLAGQLVNDLDAITSRFVLALDDYHQVSDLGVQEIVDFVVSQAPRSLHLVLICRRDPLLSLARYRARGQMVEIRMPDLRFSAADTAELLGHTGCRDLDATALERLHRATEGWPVALRLAVGALDGRARLDGLVAGMQADTRHAQDFLLEEILRHQTPAMRSWLRQTSILDRFCAGLVEAVCVQGSRQPHDGLTGEVFLERLDLTGLPAIALDGGREWRRYHHLVGDLLRRELEREFEAAGVAELHRRAAGWLEAEGVLDQALLHLIAAGDGRQAAELVLRHRDAVLGDEHWHRLERWLMLLAHDVVDGDPELLLLRAWSAEHRGRYGAFIDLVERAERLLETVADERQRDRLSAEIETIQAGVAYQGGDFASALEKSERGRERIPRESEWVWVYATKVLALSRQLAGDAGGAFAAIDEALEAGRPSEMVRGHLLTSRCFLHWIAADRAGLERTGRAILACPWSRELPETAAMGGYFLGAALYHADRLEEAASFLEPVATDPASPNVANQLRSVYALASVHLARNAAGATGELLDAAGERLHRIGNTTFLAELEAFRAEVDLRQGHVAEALRWAEGFEPAFASAAYSFFLPELTAVKAWLAGGTPAAAARAAASLERQVHQLESTHCARFLFEALALRALCREAAGERDAARADLTRALGLAQPGGYLRIFVDLGPAIAPLLHAVELGPETTRYAGEILAAFPESTGDQPLIERLTPRELEILDLIAQRLGNREIGARLHIASGTVKRHTHSLYGKLGVHDRWHAVDKARGLGMLA